MADKGAVDEVAHRPPEYEPQRQHGGLPPEKHKALAEPECHVEDYYDADGRDDAENQARVLEYSERRPGITAVGDAEKARKVLDWQPKVSFEELIDMMVAADLEIARKEKTLVDAGYACGNRRMV